MIRRVVRPPSCRPLVEADPLESNVRRLASQLLVQAVRDAKGRQPQLQEAALRWLNSEDGRGLAAAFGLSWARRGIKITTETLPGRTRNTYFPGGD